MFERGPGNGDPGKVKGEDSGDILNADKHLSSEAEFVRQSVPTAFIGKNKDTSRFRVFDTPEKDRKFREPRSLCDGKIKIPCRIAATVVLVKDVDRIISGDVGVKSTNKAVIYKVLDVGRFRPVNANSYISHAAI